MFFIKTNSLLKIFIFSSLLLIEGLIFAETTKSPVQEAWKAIWRVNDHTNTATGFFVNKNQLITNLHAVAYSLSDPTQLTLYQDLSHEILNIKQIVAIDFKHDLALLEIEGEVNSFLNIKDSKSSLDLTEKVQIPGYSEAKRSVILQPTNTQIFFHNFDRMLFQYDKYVEISGASGSPFLDKNNSVIAILFETYIPESPIHNSSVLEKGYITGTSFFHLNDFLNKKIGLNCLDFNTPLDCYKKEINNLFKQADNGDLLAQYLLISPHVIKGINTIKSYYSQLNQPEERLISDTKFFEFLQNLSSYYFTQIKSVKNTEQKYLSYAQLLFRLHLSDQMTDDTLLKKAGDFIDHLDTHHKTLLSELSLEFENYIESEKAIEDESMRRALKKLKDQIESEKADQKRADQRRADRSLSSACEKIFG